MSTASSFKIDKSKAIEQVEDFVQRLHDLEYEIDTRANLITYTNCATLADNLTNTLSRYENNRDTMLSTVYASDALLWIEKAFAAGIIHEGSAAIRKLREKETKLEEYKQRCVQLEADNQQLASEYLQLQGRYNELDARLEYVQE